MKKLLLSLLLAAPLAANAANASNSNCYDILKMSDAIMRSKQVGVPITQMINFNEQQYKKIKDKNSHDIVDYMIRDAYSQPDYSSQTYKDEQLNEFNAKYYGMCKEQSK